jgi:hypothetical protein
MIQGTRTTDGVSWGAASWSHHVSALLPTVVGFIQNELGAAEKNLQTRETLTDRPNKYLHSTVKFVYSGELRLNGSIQLSEN